MNAHTEIVEYSETAAGLADLKSRIQHVVYDVTTTVGMESARKDRRECVTLRTSLDGLRLKLNADDQARIKLRNGRAKELEAEIVALEEPIDAQIKAEEQRKEAEKQARLDAERARVAAIRSKIGAITRAPIDAIGTPLDEMRSIRTSLLQAKPEAAEYEELTHDALAVWEKAGEQIDSLIVAAERNAAEQARLAEERAAFEAEQRAHAAERAEQQRKDEVAAKVAREAQQRADAEAKAIRDAADKAAREAQEREEAAARAERQRIDEEARQRRAREDQEAAALRARQDAEAKALRDAEEARIAAVHAEAKAARDAEDARLATERAEVARIAEANRQAEQKRQREAAEAEARKRAKHATALNDRLLKFRKTPGAPEFMKAAIDYHGADQDDVAEKLVVLCELYAKRPAKAGASLSIAGEAA